MVGVIKQRIAGGDYAVDPHAVAEAILARRQGRGSLHGLCSEMLVTVQLNAGAREDDAVARDGAS